MAGYDDDDTRPDVMQYEDEPSPRRWRGPGGMPLATEEPPEPAPSRGYVMPKFDPTFRTSGWSTTQERPEHPTMPHPETPPYYMGNLDELAAGSYSPQDFKEKLAAAEPQTGLHGQALWDEIGRDMDAFQAHAHPGYQAPQGYETSGPVAHGYYAGGNGIPSLAFDTDGQVYLADNTGQRIMMGDRPVPLEDYYRSQQSAAPSPADREMMRHLHAEAAAWNTSMNYGQPEATGGFAAAIQDRHRYLGDLLQHVRQNPDLSPSARSKAESHIIGQMGSLATHWEKAQQQTRLKTQQAGLHPDYGTPQGPELSPQLQQQLQEAEAALQQVRQDHSLTVAEKTHAVQVLSNKIQAIDPAGRYRNGQQPMTPIMKAISQQVHVDKETGAIYTLDPKGGLKVTMPKGGKDQQHTNPFGMAPDKYHDKVLKYAQDRQISFQQALADHEDHARRMGLGGQAVTRDHPDIARYLRGENVPVANIAAMAHQMTPETRRHLEKIVAAGDEYGQNLVTDTRGIEAAGPVRNPNDPNEMMFSGRGESRWVPNQGMKDYQRRAADLLRVGGGVESRRMTEAQRQAAATKAATDLKNDHGRAEKVLEKHPQLTHQEALDIVQGRASAEGLPHALTVQEWRAQWNEFGKQHDKLLADHEANMREYRSEMSGWRQDQKNPEAKGAPKPEPPAPVETDRKKFIEQRMHEAGLGTTHESYIQGIRDGYQGGKRMDTRGERMAGERAAAEAQRSKPQSAPTQPPPSQPTQPEVPPMTPEQHHQFHQTTEKLLDLQIKQYKAAPGRSLDDPAEQDWQATAALRRLMLQAPNGRLWMLSPEDKWLYEQARKIVEKHGIKVPDLSGQPNVRGVKVPMWAGGEH